MTNAQSLRKEFWTDFADYADQKLDGLRKPSIHYGYGFAIGRTGFEVSLTIRTRHKPARCELYISHPKAKRAFDLLEARARKIRADLGDDVKFDRLPPRLGARISQEYPVNISDRKQWPRLRGWMTNRVRIYRTTFRALVEKLEL